MIVPTKSPDVPLSIHAEDPADTGAYWMSVGSVALVIGALVLLITAPFAMWALAAFTLAAAGVILALIARKRAIGRRRTTGTTFGLVALAAGLILALYSLPWTVVQIVIQLS